MKTALLRLLNAIHIENPGKSIRKLSERTIKNGYILHPAINPTDDLLDIVESVVGISGEKANASFHKSWSIVKDTPIETLIIQQILHYITTYGFERLGIYSEQTVYIPNEVLDLPDIRGDIPLIVIKAMNAQEILDGIVSLGSGIALAQETLNDIMMIIKDFRYDPDFVGYIKNRELKALLYDYYGIVPSDPEEFLRHLISKLTDESLIIKNDYLIGKIKAANGKFLDELLKYAPDDLASIFFRFKPLFLAMKSISRNRTFFNHLRKQANKLHKPLPEDYLNSITSQIKSASLDIAKLEQRLTGASIFRKIRLAYALNYRLFHDHSIVYRVRNGRGWATEFEWHGRDKWTTRKALDTTLTSITRDVSQNVEGKTIYIPDNVHYALPATEKQFTGHLPTGSYVTVPQDLIVGIHWFNTDNGQVDLDLSVISESGKIGWDAAYRSDNILFSGDVVTASKPDGASELFYISEGDGEARLLLANYYNFNGGDTVDCKILVAQEKPGSFGNNYMVDVSNMIATANITISKKQNVLGLISKNRVYFANVSIGNSITSSSGEQATQAQRWLVSSLKSSIDFNDILVMAGATVVNERPEGNEYVNLSPEALDKTTIMDLIK